jgi:hypothetical protein
MSETVDTLRDLILFLRSLEFCGFEVTLKTHSAAAVILWFAKGFRIVIILAMKGGDVDLDKPARIHTSSVWLKHGLRRAGIGKSILHRVLEFAVAEVDKSVFVVTVAPSRDLEQFIDDWHRKREA